MNGRVYDPYTARFLSADPHVTDPRNGQNLNRYSYVLNNPTNLTDPTGFDVVTITGERCWICHDPDFIRSTWASLKASGSQLAKNGGQAVSRVMPAARTAAAKAAKRELAAQTALVVPVVGEAVEVGVTIWGVYEIGSAIYNAATDQGADASNALSSDASSAAAPPPDKNDKNDKKDKDDKTDKQKKGKPERNVDQNKQVNDAARDEKLSPQERKELGRAVEYESRAQGKNLDYHDIREIAKDIKSGNY